VNVATPSSNLLEVTVPTEPVSVEAQMVSAALQGDGRAFASLVKPHLPMMLRIAARGSGDGSLAEDAVQEALVVAFEKLDRYRPGSSIKAFLATIVVKRVHTLRRSELRRRIREETATGPEPLPTPEQNLRRTSLALKIRDILGAMPKKRQQAVILRLDGGMNYSQIANALASNENSVRVLVHLGMKALKEGLKGALPGGHDNG
jgi:RNA polymerase sigma-70 factor (ECF subfamily)